MMKTETTQETAHALLPGLQYLAREALDAGLADVAGIIGRATADVIEWIHDNASNDNDTPGDQDHDSHLPRPTGAGPERPQ